MRTFAVSVFQLLQWKHALALEAKGLKHSRGSVRKHVAGLFGLPPRTKAAEVRTVVVNVIDSLPHGCVLTTVVEVNVQEPSDLN